MSRGALRHAKTRSSGFRWPRAKSLLRLLAPLPNHLAVAASRSGPSFLVEGRTARVSRGALFMESRAAACPELALIGALTDHEGELTAKLLEVPYGGRCTLFIDSPGGSPYSGLSLMTIMLLRSVQAPGYVT